MPVTGSQEAAQLRYEHRPSDAQLPISPAELKPRLQHGGTHGDPPRLCVCRVRGCFCGSARPIHSLRLLFVSRTDSSARIDAWEKLIAACSCCSRAPLQLPCPADAPGNRGGVPCGSQLLLATECRRAESRIQALFFFLFGKDGVKFLFSRDLLSPSPAAWPGQVGDTIDRLLSIQ